jgi:hypothetical protein
MLSKAFASEPKGSDGKSTSMPEGKMQGEGGAGLKSEADPSYLRFDKRAEEVTTYRK